ncbi:MULTISPECIES: hypothetical protein [Maribacter]|uniref:hypothetical protein n=1 Tax=Maribacter TaxID=252356 RepID=UPI001B098345|nr:MULTISPECIES: hypothetical protein [Maribacter]CAG2531820.1 hypothetical protein MAR621_02349 [Maribacter dokdonensis]|tara:strand:+ start:125772 stop:126257 length:486 start_codon:yes stop_codon:yes gene_type:complete
MTRTLIIIFGFILLLGCKEKKNNSERTNRNAQSEYNSDYKENDNWDGEYCADIEYYNPSTGTSSDYTLTIEVSDNELEQINWPNGGYLDDFSSVEFDEDGYAEFTSDKGYDYTVQITGDTGDCFENVPMAEQCNGITEDGDQCENSTDNYSGYCWQHEDQE